MAIRWGVVQDSGGIACDCTQVWGPRRGGKRWNKFSLQHAVFQRVAGVLDDGNDLSSKLVFPDPHEQFRHGKA